jgi:hypothetical protein
MLVANLAHTFIFSINRDDNSGVEVRQDFRHKILDALAGQGFRLD